MIAHHATVLNHDLARGLALLRGLIVPNSKLHPDDSRGRLDRLVHDRRYVRRRTEDVDGVEGNRDGVERWIRFLRVEPPNLRMLFVRNLRLPIPLGDEEQVVPEEVLRSRIDVFIDAEEPRPERRDPQLLFELADQGGRRLFARDEMSPEGVPHAREPNHASAPTEEDPTVASDQPRRGDVNHTGIMDVLRYSFFFEDRDDGHPPSPPKIGRAHV